MPSRCKVIGCTSIGGDEWSFHAFPDAIKRPQEHRFWLDFCGRKSPPGDPRAGICQLHFLDSDFSSKKRKITEGGKNILRKEARPSLNGPLVLCSQDGPARTANLEKTVTMDSSDSDVIDCGIVNPSVNVLLEMIRILPSLPAGMVCQHFRRDEFFLTSFGFMNPNVFGPATLFDRCLYFKTDLVPHIEVHGVPYMGDLISCGVKPVSNAEDLWKLLQQFSLLVTCPGTTPGPKRRTSDSIEADLFRNEVGDVVFRHVLCSQLVRVPTSGIQRCKECQTYERVARKRISDLDDGERPGVHQKLVGKIRQFRNQRRAHARKSKKLLVAKDIIAEHRAVVSLDCALSHMPEQSQKILKEMIQISKTPKNRRRFSPLLMDLAMVLQQQGPRSYGTLSAVLPFMPAKCTIQRLKQVMPTSCGITSFMMSVLKWRVDQLAPEDRNVSLNWDEDHLQSEAVYNVHTDIFGGKPDLAGYENLMTPKQRVKYDSKLANYQLCLVIGGVRKKFAIPIATYLSYGAVPGKALAAIIVDAVRRINEVGFNVVFTGSDGSSTNCCALRQLGLFAKDRDGLPKHYFEVGGKKIFHIFDPPHLLKNIVCYWRDRNKQMTFVDKSGEVFMDEGIDIIKADFSFVEKLHEFDRESGKRLVPHLTDRNHINPKSFAKMKVSYAAEIASETVARSIDLLRIEGNYKFYGSEPTVDLLRMIDEMFDLLNTSHSDDKKAIRRPYSKAEFLDEGERIHKLHHLRNRLCSWRSKVGKKDRLPDGLIDRCVMSISSALDGMRELFHNFGQDYFSLRLICNDIVEFLISRLRAVGGERCSTLTAARAKDAFRIVTLTCIQNPSKFANVQTGKFDPQASENNLISFLRTYKSEGAPAVVKTGYTDHELDQLIMMQEEIAQPELVSDVRNDIFPAERIEKQMTYYLTGSICNRRKKDLTRIGGHPCEDCWKLLTLGADEPKPWYSGYTEMQTRGNLTFVSKPVFILFDAVDQNFKMISEALKDKRDLNLGRLTFEFMKSKGMLDNVGSENFFAPDISACGHSLKKFLVSAVEQYVRLLYKFLAVKQSRLHQEKAYGSAKAKNSREMRMYRKHTGDDINMAVICDFQE